MFYIVGSILMRVRARLVSVSGKNRKSRKRRGSRTALSWGYSAGDCTMMGGRRGTFFFFAEYRSGGKKCFNATVSCVIGDKELCQLEDAE